MNLRKSIAGVSLLVVAGCGGGSSIGGLDAEAVFVFPLTQAQEIPAPKPTSASGTAQVVLYADKVDYEITGNSITGVTMAHIHTGAAGVAGPIYVTLLNRSDQRHHHERVADIDESACWCYRCGTQDAAA